MTDGFAPGTADALQNMTRDELIAGIERLVRMRPEFGVRLLGVWYLAYSVEGSGYVTRQCSPGIAEMVGYW